MELLDFSRSHWNNSYDSRCYECQRSHARLIQFDVGCELEWRICPDCLRRALEMVEPTGKPETFALGAIAQALAEKP